MHTFSVEFEWVEVLPRTIRFIVVWSYAIPASNMDIVAIFHNNVQVNVLCFVFYAYMCVYIYTHTHKTL
jgi:hypothetical protein